MPDAIPPPEFPKPGDVASTGEVVTAVDTVDVVTGVPGVSGTQTSLMRSVTLVNPETGDIRVAQVIPPPVDPPPAPEQQKSGKEVKVVPCL